MNGVLANNAVINSADYNTIGAGQGTFLGMVGTKQTGNVGQLEDSGGTGAIAGNRLVINMYNRVSRTIQATPGYVDNNANSTYTTASISFVTANAGTGNRITFLSLGEDATHLGLNLCAGNSGAAGQCRCGLGIDSTTTSTVGAFPVSSNATDVISAALSYDTLLAAGFHTVDLLIAVSAGTGTFYADTSRFGGASDPKMTSIQGFILG